MIRPSLSSSKHTPARPREAEIRNWWHPFRVMERLPPWSSADMKHAALLHDVLEKTAITKSDLASRGYSDWVSGAVSTLSRPEDKPHEDWIYDLAATADPLTIIIKLADLEDHLDPREIDKTPSRTAGLLEIQKSTAVFLC